MLSIARVTSLALVVATGCYDSSGRTPDAAVVDAAIADAARVAPDAGVDAAMGCEASAVCDDGDPCTNDDRCRAGSCVGMPVICDAPPGMCFAGDGECVDGECVYAPDDGASCDDGDPCTTSDVCAEGACAGSLVVCGGAPPNECVDASTLRTNMTRGVCGDGSCDYLPVERPCPDGWVDGACRCVPSPWVTEVVDDRFHGDGGPTEDAVAVDRLGGVHAVYPVRHSNDDFHTQYYAHRSPGGDWGVETLGPGWNGVIDVDPAGAVHVIYFDQLWTGFVYATRTSTGGWAQSMIPLSDVTARTVRIAVDDRGVVHIVVHRGWRGLTYGRRSTGGTWTFEEVHGEPVDARIAVAVDASGGVHVGYARAGRRYAYRAPGGGWTRSLIAADRLHTLRFDIALDPSGGVHLLMGAPLSAHRFGLAHARLPPGGGPWQVAPIEEAGTIEYGSAMAIDAHGVLHAVYQAADSDRGHVRRVARDPSGRWSDESIDSDSVRAYGTSLALDEDGTLHVVFRTRYALVHASRRVCP